MTKVVKIKVSQRRKTNPTKIKKIPVKHFQIRRTRSATPQSFRLTLNLEKDAYDPSNIVKVVFEKNPSESRI